MNPIITGSFSIHLYVRDLEKAAEWYRDHLGFTVGPHDYNDFVELHLNGRHILHLFKSDQIAAPHGRPSFYLDSADIETAYSSLKQKGVELSPLTHRSDHSSFRLTDPEGNVIGMSHFR